MVSEGGLEPPRPCGHQPLKLARLPIPPLRLACDSEERPESVARGRLPSWPRPVAGSILRAPASDGVVLFVDSATRTAQYWAYHSRLLLVGVGVTLPTLRLADQGRRLGEERESDDVVPQLHVGRLVVGRGRGPSSAARDALVTRLSNVLLS